MARESDGPGGRLARLADQEARRRQEARQPQSAKLRDRDQGAVGRAAGEDSDRLRGAHTRLAAFDGHVRRRVDLRALEQSRFHRNGHCLGVRESALSSAIGDSASFVDSQRLKGIHLAIKSGMLAAETIFEALKAEDTSAKTLSAFPKKVEASYVKDDLWKVRNFHQAFSHGMIPGFFQAGLQFVTGGRGLIDPMRAESGYKHYHKINGRAAPERFKGDGKLTFDRLTDVYHSGTRHNDDQPCHLHVLDLDICANRCAAEYCNPCQYFCPAAVYEPVQEKDGFKLRINFANCVHCKTCDIADPYQIIDWVVPEGGGGPNYEGM